MFFPLSRLFNLEEAKPLPIGSHRKWKGGVYIKIGIGKWVPKPKEKSGSSKKEIQAAIDTQKLSPGLSVDDHRRMASDVRKSHNRRLHILKQEMRAIAPNAVSVVGRVKTESSMLGKLARKPENYPDVSKMTDVTGVRIVHNTINEVMDTVAKIRKQHKVVEEEDAIANPKGDYRSYHMLVKDKDGLVKEVQVRTRLQDAFANWSHQVYKPFNRAQEKLLKDEESKKAVIGYAARMSHRYFSLDSGGSSVPPPDPCPPVAKKTLGCLPSN